MNDPLVSIIIPVFNAEKHLAKTIAASLNQTWKNKEVILVDDGSSDNSLQIAYSFKSPYLQVITQKQKGASSARNAGLKKASGEYVQFLDADDIISDNKIEAQIKLLLMHPDYLCLCPTVYFDDKQHYTERKPNHDWTSKGSTNTLEFLIKLYGGELNDEGGSMIQPNAWLTPREVIDRAGFWNENLTVDDDGEFFCRVILASKGIVYAPGAVNYYRKHHHRNSLSGQLNLNGFESMLQSLSLKQQYLEAYCKPALIKKIFASHYWSIALLAYPRFKLLSSKAVKLAKEGNYTGKKYSGGPVSSLLSKVVGWRIMRYISYIRYGF